ncbi:MAG: hypothetical protein HOE90_12380 [Bacteriovoracaceae bacterium]|jgi:DNA-binding XRE family transcriptional regulator|nr:hypothetical protein [Bacteriovoracaceae bacterium]
MFGKKNNVRVNVILDDYNKSYHTDLNCDGRFELIFIKDYIYTGSNLGPVKLGVAPTVSCKKCEAEYLAPGFSNWLEREIAKRLILSKGLLSKNQIKFLRLDFDFSQEELGHRIGLRKEQISKMENSKYDDHMSADKQFRLKFHLAKLLKLDDMSKLHEMPTDRVIDVSKIIPSKKEIERVFQNKAA